MTEKVKIEELKSKIKSLQTQIEEKNNLLQNIKTNQSPLQQKIKILNSITEVKLKNMNYSLQQLQKENESLRNPLENPAEEQKLLPVIKEKSNHNRQKSDETRRLFNKEFLTKLTNSPLQNKPSYNLVSNDYEFSSIIRQLDALKSENLHLKKRLKDTTIKYNKELEIRTKEIEEMSTIRKDYTELSEKFDELKKIIRDNGSKLNQNGVLADNEDILNEQIKELEKKYAGNIYENERLRQSLKTIKLKVKYLILDRKKTKNDNFSQYSMNMDEKFEELKEEELELQVFWKLCKK